jgi:hypothetical protein
MRGSRIAILVVSLSLCTLGTECVLHLFRHFRPIPRTYVGEYQNRTHSYWVTDPQIGWRMRPHVSFGLYQSNAEGFRGPTDLGSTKSCNRIVFVGDSFTYGIGVPYEQTFAALIEAQTSGSCVTNMGLPGFGLDQIWQTVRTQALPVHPHLVVVAFIGEDLGRSEEAYRDMEGFNKPTFKLVDGLLVPKNVEDRPNFAVRFLEHHSSLWRLVRFSDRELSRFYPHGEYWNLNTAILDAIQADCSAAKVPVLFIYIPTRAWGKFPALHTYLDQARINFIDLSLGQFALARDMYSEDDLHLNEKGNRQVANAILSWIHASRLN